MDTNHLNTYVNLIEALLQCPKGEEWLLLQQHQDLIDPKLLTVMAQIAEKLNAEGNAPAAKFLHYWKNHLTHLLQQNTAQTLAESRWHSLSERESPSYLELIQTLLECAKGDEAAILSQHPALMDEELVYTMKQVAAQLAAQGSQDIAIYLKHLAAEIHHGWLQPNEQRGRSPISSPPPERLAVCLDAHNSQIEELLANISSRLEKLEILLSKHSAPPNPLWYLPILEQVDRRGWIISSEEVEQLIGIKPHCEPGHNSLVRGCWKFIKVGKIGTHSSWRVSKEISNLPKEVTPEPEHPESEAQLSSPWSETN